MTQQVRILTSYRSRDGVSAIVNLLFPSWSFLCDICVVGEERETDKGKSDRRLRGIGGKSGENNEGW